MSSAGWPTPPSGVSRPKFSTFSTGSDCPLAGPAPCRETSPDAANHFGGSFLIAVSVGDRSSGVFARRENVIALGPSGTGKTHVSLGLGLAACQKGLSVGFTTAAALVHELMEARDERRLLRLQKQMAGHKLLIIDELGFVPLTKTGAELLFELISQRYERGSTLITSNLPFDEWTETFGSERLTGALLDRLTHHVTILEMNGDSYRLAQSRTRKTPANA